MMASIVGKFMVYFYSGLAIGGTFLKHARTVTRYKDSQGFTW